MSTLHENSRFALMFVGAYTGKSDVGITSYRLDLETGEAVQLHQVQTIRNASYLTTDAGRERLYAVSEVEETNGTLGGEVVSYHMDTVSGSLTELGRQLTHGKHPCYVSLSDASESPLLFVTNYSSGNVSVYPLSTAGDLLEPASQVIQHEGASGATSRQFQAHTHSIVVHPTSPYAVVSDLGMDRLFVYRIDAANKQLTLHNRTATAAGAGPRHFVFHPDMPYAYGINELDNTMTAYLFDEEAGSLTALQSVPALPDHFTGDNTTADLHIEPTGRFIYGSNRGDDSLVVYKINPESGRMTYVEHVSTQGRTPRNFAIAPGGRLLLAANQQSDTIELFRLDPVSGKLTHLPELTIAVSAPVCIRFV